MKRKKLLDQIQVKQKNAILVQGRIPSELHQKVSKILAREGISWRQFIEAAARQLIDEI